MVGVAKILSVAVIGFAATFAFGLGLTGCASPGDASAENAVAPEKAYVPAKGAPVARPAPAPAAPAPAPAAPAPAPALGRAAPAPVPAPEAEPRESLSPPPNGDDALERAGWEASLRENEEKALAQHYFEVGKKLYAELDYQRAYENFRRSVELDPSNEEAARFYHDAGSLLGIRQDELDTTLERARREQEVKVQLYRQQMVHFFESGEKRFNAKEFDLAIRDLERAREMIEWYPYQIDTGTPPYRERAEKMINEAKKLRRLQEFEEAERKEDQALARAQTEEKLQRDIAERRIQTLLEQTIDLLETQKYREAYALAGEVLELEPGNPLAKKLLESAQTGIHIQRRQKAWEDNLEERWEDELNIRRAETPIEDDIVTWDDAHWLMIKDRTGGIAERRDAEQWEKQYRKVLKERKLTLNFPEGTTLKDAIQFFQEVTGLNFVIKDIDANEIKVSLKLKDIVIENALKILLDQTNLAMTFDREAIIITEPGAARGDMYMEIYDVSDILYKIRDFTAPRLQLPNPDAAAGGGGPSASFIFEEEGAEGEGTLSGEILIDITKSTTGEDIWESPALIEQHRGQLLVTNTREVHDKIADILENIRRNSGLFVHIEARFIDVTNDFLEDIGVDYRGLGGNPGDERLIGGAPNPNTTNPFGDPRDIQLDPAKSGGTDIGATKRNHTPGAPNPGPNPSIGNQNFGLRTQNIIDGTSGAIRGTRLIGGTGGIFQLTNLDPFQINAIIRAEGETSKVRRLTAPRVTAANREKVFVRVVTQRAYIADYELISGGTGLVVIEVPDPIVETFLEGVVLEVRPTVSADRKYVTLDCRPSLATLVGGTISTITVNLGSIQMSAINVPIGVPEIQLEEAFTSVTIPDNGTALLGGFRQVLDSRDEVTVPFLGEVPLLKKLFSRVGEIRETRSLIILITAKIVSIRDEEGRRFNKK